MANISNVWLEIKLFVGRLTLSLAGYPPAALAGLRAFQEKCQELLRQWFDWITSITLSSVLHVLSTKDAQCPVQAFWISNIVNRMNWMTRAPALMCAVVHYTEFLKFCVKRAKLGKGFFFLENIPHFYLLTWIFWALHCWSTFPPCGDKLFLISL